LRYLLTATRQRTSVPPNRLIRHKKSWRSVRRDRRHLERDVAAGRLMKIHFRWRAKAPLGLADLPAGQLRTIEMKEIAATKIERRKAGLSKRAPRKPAKRVPTFP